MSVGLTKRWKMKGLDINFNKIWTNNEWSDLASLSIKGVNAELIKSRIGASKRNSRGNIFENIVLGHTYVPSRDQVSNEVSPDT